MTLEINSEYSDGDTVRRELFPMYGLVLAVVVCAGAWLRMNEGAGLVDLSLLAAGLLGAVASLVFIVRQYRRRRQRLRSHQRPPSDA